MFLRAKFPLSILFGLDKHVFPNHYWVFNTTLIDMQMNFITNNFSRQPVYHYLI